MASRHFLRRPLLNTHTFKLKKVLNSSYELKAREIKYLLVLYLDLDI
jgi:hypothetical protein